MNWKIERRRTERYTLPAMYTHVSVHEVGGAASLAEGHAYDISATGLRFESDRDLPAGSLVEVRLSLPRGMAPDAADDRPIGALVRVLRQVDQDDPGPHRLAAIFERFKSDSDRRRLLERLASGAYPVAA